MIHVIKKYILSREHNGQNCSHTLKCFLKYVNTSRVRHIISPCKGMRGCAILEELDNLCNFCCRLRNRLMLPVVIMTKANTCGNQSKRSRGRNLKWLPHSKPKTVFGVISSSHRLKVHLLLIPSTPMQRELIKTPSAT